MTWRDFIQRQVSNVLDEWTAHLLVGAAILVMVVLGVGALLLREDWEHERCIAALTTPNTNPAVIMSMCQ